MSDQERLRAVLNDIRDVEFSRPGLNRSTTVRLIESIIKSGKVVLAEDAIDRRPTRKQVSNILADHEILNPHRARGIVGLDIAGFIKPDAAEPEGETMVFGESFPIGPGDFDTGDLPSDAEQAVDRWGLEPDLTGIIERVRHRKGNRTIPESSANMSDAILEAIAANPALYLAGVVPMMTVSEVTSNYWSFPGGIQRWAEKHVGHLIIPDPEPEQPKAVPLPTVEGIMDKLREYDALRAGENNVAATKVGIAIREDIVSLALAAIGKMPE